MNWTRQQYVDHYDLHYQHYGLDAAGTNETERKYDMWVSQGYKPDMRVLDYGCGTGVMSQFVKPKNYIGLDISKTAVELARRQFPGHLFESFKIGLAPLFKADMVVAHSVFTHTPFDTVSDSLEDIKKNMGFAIIDILHGEDDPRDIHVRHYSPEHWRRRLAQAGLKGALIAEIAWNNGYTHHYYGVEHDD